MGIKKPTQWKSNNLTKFGVFYNVSGELVLMEEALFNPFRGRDGRWAKSADELVVI